MEDLLKNAQNLGGQAVNSVESLLGSAVNAVGQAFQPKPLSPVPQAQTMPQAQPSGIQGLLSSLPQETMNALSSIGQGAQKTVGNMFNGLKQDVSNVGNNIGNAEQNAVYNLGQSPVGKLLVGAQTQVAQPLITGFTKFGADYSPVFHDQLEQAYQGEKGLGWDGGKNASLLQSASQAVGQTIPFLPVAELGGGLVSKGMEALGIGAPATAIGRGVLGVTQSALTGGALGLAQPANNGSDRFKNMLESAAQFAPFGLGAMLPGSRLIQGLAGAGIGGAQALGTDILSGQGVKPSDILGNALMGGILSGMGAREDVSKSPKVDQYFRDNQGQFATPEIKTPSQIKKAFFDTAYQITGKTPGEPLYPSDLMKVIRNEQGFIKPGAFIPGMGESEPIPQSSSDLASTVEEKPTIKQELTQQPLPPRMSSKALSEGIEAPRTGRDISVSPQAQKRFESKSEPLPWETTSDLMSSKHEQPSGSVLPGESQKGGFETQGEGKSLLNQLKQPKSTVQESTDTAIQKNASSGQIIPQETGDKKVNEILRGGKHAIDNGIGLPAKPNGKENPIQITNPNYTVRDARAAMDTAKTQIEARGRVVQQLVKNAVKNAGVSEDIGNETNNGANRLFRQAIEHPENEADILKQVKNPTEFKNALDQFRAFTNYNLQAAQGAGAKLQGLPNYYSHIWDLSDPQQKALFDELAQAKAKNFKGWFNKQRVFNDIEEGEAKNFRLKNKSVADDVADYTNAFSKEQGARVLSKALVQNFPGKAVVVDGEGAPINAVQSRIPGTKGLYLSQDLHKQLADLEPAPQSTAGKIISHINNFDKEMRLSGGLFHVQNTGWDYLSSNLGFGRFPRVLTAAKVFLSPSSYIDYMRGAINDGTIDKMAQANISFDTKQDFAGTGNALQKTGKIIDKFNPLSQLNKATFSRLENFFKIEAFKALDNRGLIDTSTPEGMKTAQGYGREINNMFGGQNRRVGDDIFNKSPQGKFIANNLLALAPDYQQGRFKRSLSAFGFGNGEGFNPLKRSAANNYAAYTLLTRMVLTAVATEAIRRAITGKFSQNLISAVQNDIFDPNFPTPWKNTSASGTKESQTAHLPATNLSDIYRLIQDPTHFIISHTPAALSDYTGFASNQDYFGNKLSQTNNPVEKLLKVVQNDLPIPAVQTQKLLQGKVAPGNALLNELGARVSLDPNDPTALYFGAQNKALQGIDPKMQQAYGALQAVSTLDPNDPRRKQIESTIYQAYPQLFDVNKKANIAGANGNMSKVDPLYSADPKVSKAYLEYQQLNSTAPGSAEEKQFLKNHPEVLQLIQDRSKYFAANPIPQKPGAIPYIPPPQASAYVQQQLTAKNFTDPQVQSYLSQHLDYVNQQRAKLGLDPIDSYGNIQGSKNYGVSLGGGISSGLRRNLLRENRYSIKTGFNKLGGMLQKAGQTAVPYRKAPRLTTRPIGNRKTIATLPKHGKQYTAHTTSSLLSYKGSSPKFHKLPLPARVKPKAVFI